MVCYELTSTKQLAAFSRDKNNDFYLFLLTVTSTIRFTNSVIILFHIISVVEIFSVTFYNIEIILVGHTGSSLDDYFVMYGTGKRGLGRPVHCNMSQ